MTNYLYGALLGLALTQASPADPVEALRQVLKAPTGAPEQRDRSLGEAAGRLNGLPELARALALQEWRDGDLDSQVAEVDRRHRTALAGRFQQMARAVFERGSPPNQSAAADLVGQLGVAGPGDQIRPLAPDLVRLAHRGHPMVREAAVRALGRVAPEPAVALPVLRELLTAGAPPIRREAAGAVFNLLEAAGKRTAPGKGGSLQELVEVGSALLPLAGVAMQDDDTTIRRTGLAALERTIAAVIPLVALDQRSPAVQPLLPVIRNQGAALARIIADSDPGIRLGAYQVVEEIGRLHAQLPHAAAGQTDPLSAMLGTVLPPLAKGLSDSDVRLRRAALAALETWGAEAAPVADAIYGSLEDTDRFIRWGAARLVGRIGPTPLRDAVPALLRLLYDSDFELRLAAVNTLQHYGPLALPAVPRLSEMVAGPEALPVQLAALRTLGAVGKVGVGRTLPVLRKALDDPEPTIRATAAQALGALGRPARPAAAELQKHRDDPAAEVRQAADAALLRVFAGEEKPALPSGTTPKSR